MTDDSAPVRTDSPPRASRDPYRAGAWVVVLLALLFAGLVRARLLSVPFERDEGEYAYAGQLILQGIPPYRMVYNMKLPGTYAAYAIVMALFGQTVRGVLARDRLTASSARSCRPTDPDRNMMISGLTRLSVSGK